jgi:hypothetical protein
LEVRIVGHELANVLEDRATFFNRIDNAGEVVVKQHQVRRFARHVRAGDAHSDALVRTRDGGPLHQQV